jgi:hypothetical protein
MANIFLYEDEEGNFQNKVEAWWIRLHDKQKAARSKVAVFMQEVARSTGNGFDRLFGHHLISFRIVPVSIYLSIASFFLLIWIMFPRIKNPGPIHRHEAFFWFVCFVGLAVLPTFMTRRWQFALWWVIIPVNILGATGFIVFVFITRGAHFALQLIGLLLLLFGCSLVFDVFYIVLTRLILKRISRIDHTLEILLMILLNIVLLIVPILGPYYFGLRVFKNHPHAGAVVFFSMVFNVIDVFAGMAALIVAALLLIHRLFWPALNRPLYAIYRYAPVKEKKWLFRFGCILLFFPVHLTAEGIRAILEKLG